MHVYLGHAHGGNILQKLQLLFAFRLSRDEFDEFDEFDEDHELLISINCKYMFIRLPRLHQVC